MLVGGQQTTIDTFFRSLAEHQGLRAIGVVLSGNASDGTIGLKGIKAAGGIAFAQDPTTAKFEGMPRSAIVAGCVDFVLKPAEIAAELMRLRSHPYVKGAVDTLQREAIPVADDAMMRILTVIRNSTGVDFSQYKPNTVRRRIFRRVMLRRADTLEKYFELLRNDSSEVRALYEDILINVTEFLRDAEVFEALNTIVFPRITQPRRSERRQVRVWIPGCSTGEEVYSIAIALLEYLGERADEISIQIFATDLSESALEKARAAFIPHRSLRTSRPNGCGAFLPRSRRDTRYISASASCASSRATILRKIRRFPTWTSLVAATCSFILVRSCKSELFRRSTMR